MLALNAPAAALAVSSSASVVILWRTSCSRRAKVADASARLASSFAILASACWICALTRRSSSWKSTWPSCTRSPSEKPTEIIWPSTRVRTATVASASTVPGDVKMTGMSVSTTVATVTGAAAGPDFLPGAFVSDEAIGTTPNLSPVSASARWRASGTNVMTAAARAVIKTAERKSLRIFYPPRNRRHASPSAGFQQGTVRQT